MTNTLPGTRELGPRVTSFQRRQPLIPTTTDYTLMGA
ncbi:hypothetical protein SAMN05421543_1028 [Alicyclobacillus macrosporangiidus]|uniref:Uncharacterized protein n=1 Tax=Alicyclobacillus macrosporangiidus TaxID=392015 RepID=A0A1I7G5I5_9BACL|nr:hypothetical protein SAMN05421543_1028 [Alicyclobacillus macrosporangiidus]